MNEEIKNILSEAASVLERLEKGQTYPADYVVNRFEKAAQSHPTDQLIGNMRDVLCKVASKREFFHQKEIGKLYDEMYGLAGGHTAFREALGDLLPEDRQLAKVAHRGSNIRKMEEKTVRPIYADSELSDAFSVLFSLGGNSAFSTFKPGQDKSVQKAVIAKLSGLGYMPEGVDILETNEHFALCAANYKTASLRGISTLIPVQISNGVTQEPKHIILGGEAVELDGRNLYTAIKEAERDQSTQSNRKFASERGDGTPGVKIEKVVVPKSLEKLADIESTLVAAASKFDTNQVNMAVNMLSAELTSFGAASPEIKIASSDERGILFAVNVPTRLGRSTIHVPVEIHNNTPMIPSKFATDITSNEKKVYDFSESGFRDFASDISENSPSLKMARQSGPLGSMSYHQLMDQMIEGVANKDYKLAEDVLSTIQHRFGSDKFVVALDQFSQLLKHSSEGSKRKELIKAAFDRGELIRVPTSVELYCPKLGLPVSRVTFDEKGRIVPKGRRSKAENQIQGSMINNNRILFT